MERAPRHRLSRPELGMQKHVAADPHQPLETRLEAYEDIVESEVGDTSLTRSRNIERDVGLRQIYLKFEGGNPTGAQKDRIAFAQAMDALRRGFDAICVATCGNYGAAMANCFVHGGHSVHCLYSGRISHAANPRDDEFWVRDRSRSRELRRCGNGIQGKIRRG